MVTAGSPKEAKKRAATSHIISRYAGARSRRPLKLDGSSWAMSVRARRGSLRYATLRPSLRGLPPPSPDLAAHPWEWEETIETWSHSKRKKWINKNSSLSVSRDTQMHIVCVLCARTARQLHTKWFVAHFVWYKILIHRYTSTTAGYRSHWRRRFVRGCSLREATEATASRVAIQSSSVRRKPR